MADITRPIGDQLRFVSSQTGDHNLDLYLEACEKGGRRLYDLLDDIYDAQGKFKGSLFEFRTDTSGRLQFRIGIFTDPNAGWLSSNQDIFKDKGVWAPNVQYNRLDCVSLSGAYRVCLASHLSTGTPDLSKWSVVIDTNTIANAVDARLVDLENITASNQGQFNALTVQINTFDLEVETMKLLDLDMLL